jgi:hypothetical protein
MTAITTLILHELGKGRYRVDLDNGEVLVASAYDPEHAAARALMARGVTGQLQTLHAGSPTICLSGDIAAMAQLSVTDEDGRLVFRKWRPQVSNPVDRLVVGSLGRRDHQLAA